MRGILFAQLLKDPDRKTSFPSPVQRKTVGLSKVGPLSSASRSCCHARNSSFSEGACHIEHVYQGHKRIDCCNKKTAQQTHFDVFTVENVCVLWAVHQDFGPLPPSALSLLRTLAHGGPLTASVPHDAVLLETGSTSLGDSVKLNYQLNWDLSAFIQSNVFLNRQKNFIVTPWWLMKTRTKVHWKFFLLVNK